MQSQQQYANQVEDNYVNEELFMTDHDMNKQENANAHLIFSNILCTSNRC